jgi:hypothetical protein
MATAVLATTGSSTLVENRQFNWSREETLRNAPTPRNHNRFCLDRFKLRYYILQRKRSLISQILILQPQIAHPRPVNHDEQTFPPFNHRNSYGTGCRAKYKILINIEKLTLTLYPLRHSFPQRQMRRID